MALDERTDIYALGCILYEMVTGIWPFGSGFMPTTLAEFQAAHERSDFLKLTDPKLTFLNPLLQSCLAKAKSDRPVDVTDLMARLLNLYSEYFGDTALGSPASSIFTADDYHNRGTTYHMLGMYTYAQADYDQVIALGLRSAEVYTNRGNNYHSLGQYTLAIADYNRAIDLDPNDTRVYVGRGISHRSLGQHELALADYDRAIELAPDYATAYVNRGSAYVDLGKHWQAIADFGRAIGLDPNLAIAHWNLGALLANKGQLRRALSCFEEAARLGDPQGLQAATQVKRMLGLESVSKTDRNVSRRVRQKIAKN